jgi:predicted dehydrogenase
MGGPRYWPVAHIIGYEHTFINTVADLMDSVAEGKMPWPNFEDGCKTQAVLEACGKADSSKKWEKVPKIG